MPIFGIDLGSASSVIATVGKREVTIVRNDLADRLTPTLVSYTDKERLIGDAALTSMKSNMTRTTRYFKNLLGAINDKSCDPVRAIEEEFVLAPIVPTDAAGLLGYDVGRSNPVTATEILACYLKRLRSIGEAFIGTACGDVVVAVPSWFTDVNRMAVLDACDIAGLKCYRVMSHTAATALNYGLFRSSTFQADKTQVVAFVDIGAAAASVTIAEFQPDRLRIAAVEERTDLGGRSLDRLLIMHLAELFKSKTKRDVFTNPRAALKVAEAAEKAKKVLSANKEASVHIECLMGDEDLEALITREQFEELAGPYNKLLHELVSQAIAKANCSVEDIKSVEIVGGGTRVPFVQATIEKLFGRPVSRTVSADECVARGAAIQGAMLHPFHRVKDFQVIDVRTTPVYVTLSAETAGSAYEMVKDEAKPMVFAKDTTFELFPIGTPSYYLKWLLFPPSVASCARVTFDLSTVNHHGSLISLGTAEVIVPDAVRQRAAAAEAGKARLKVCFKSDIHGIVQVCAIFAEDYVEKETIVVSKDIPNEAGEMVRTQVEEQEDRLKTRKTDLEVRIERPLGWLSAKELNTMKEREQVFASEDDAAQRARHIANEILSCCFSIRQELTGSLAPFVTPEETSGLEQKTREWEMFVEENQGLTYEEYLPTWEDLKKHYDPILGRKQAHDEEVRRQEEEARRLEEEELRKAEEVARAAQAAEQEKSPENSNNSSPNVVVDDEMDEGSPNSQNQ